MEAEHEIVDIIYHGDIRHDPHAHLTTDGTHPNHPGVEGITTHIKLRLGKPFKTTPTKVTSRSPRGPPRTTPNNSTCSFPQRQEVAQSAPAQTAGVKIPATTPLYEQEPPTSRTNIMFTQTTTRSWSSTGTQIDRVFNLYTGIQVHRKNQRPTKVYSTENT